MVVRRAPLPLLTAQARRVDRLTRVVEAGGLDGFDGLRLVGFLQRFERARNQSALVDHPAVAEAAVVGKAHEMKGQAVAAFVTLKDGQEPTPALERELADAKKALALGGGPRATTG